MGKKKMLMSITASAIVASGFVAAEEVSASSHKVQSGDTLWSIAKRYNISVAQIKSLNKLSNDLIVPNQVLKVTKSEPSKPDQKASSPKPKTKSQNKAKSQGKSKGTYTVKAGDTLSRIAQLHNVSINDLLKWNNLNSTLIYPGNVFYVSENNSPPPANKSTNAQSKNVKNENSVNTATYTVKSGDSLSKIASQYKTSVANLKSWNNLNSDLIRIGQQLIVTDGVKVSAVDEENKKTNLNEPETDSDNKSNIKTYTVKSGDTLSRIAQTYNVSVQNIKKWNKLNSDTIFIGQKLTLNGDQESIDSTNTEENNTPKDISYNVDNLINVAKQALGTKYTWGGQTLNGFDCSGFLHWAYNGAGMKMNRLSTDGYYNRSYYVTNPKVGDLVFFKNTYRSGISHAGIYIGNNEFIHAGTSSGVTISNLNSSYWQNHYDGFKRFY